MLCRSPYVQGMHAYGCGQCMPCRVNRRRLWTHRLMLESAAVAEKAFVTLSYSPEKIRTVLHPTSGQRLGTLVPEDVQLWLKRFRKRIFPRRVRYYVVGEYGDETWRPHYHLALFGFGPCFNGRSRYSKLYANCCPVCDTIRDTWGLGFIYVGELEIRSAAYIAGYMLKKMTKVDDERLQGRSPEYARMSLRPGIGAAPVLQVAQTLLDLNVDEKLTDVPGVLRHSGKLMPLGRYLQRRLRSHLGRDVSAPKEVLDEIQAELLPLWDRACSVAEVPEAVESIFKSLVVKEGEQAVANMASKMKIYGKRGKLL